MLKKINLFLAVILAMSSAFNLQGLSAEEYQLEANGAYNYKSYSDDFDVKNYVLDLKYYFKGINLDNEPYMEADYLQKAGYVNMSGYMGFWKIGSEDMEFEYEKKGFAAEIKYVFPVIPLYIIAGYQRDLLTGDNSLVYEDYELSSELDDTLNTFTGSVGFYLADGFTIAGRYERVIDNYEDKTVTNFPPFGGDVEIEKEEIITNTLGGSFKYVTMIDDSSWVNLEGSYNRLELKSDGDGAEKHINNIFKIRTDVYIIPRLGIGGFLELNSGDDKTETGDTIGVAVSAFFTPNIGLGAEYSYFKADEKDNDNVHDFIISVTGRI